MKMNNYNPKNKKGRKKLKQLRPGNARGWCEN